MQKLLMATLVGTSLLALGCSRAEPGQATPSASATASPVGPLGSGAPAPDVTFALHNGEKLSKDDTPGCTVEAQEIRDLYTELKATNAVVIGVSTDGADSHRAFAEKHALPFLLASDQSFELAKAFGVPLKNDRTTRVSFVIGADGRIKRSFPAVTPKGHAAELLAAISS